MTGHEPILSMRKAGISPGVVFINEYECSIDWAKFGDFATVKVSPTEAIETLDFRFVVGLTVSISGSTIDRAKRIAQACQKAGAVTVAAGCVQHNAQGYARPGWSEIWYKPALVKAA